MAQITTLKDNEGKTLYPVTSSQAVLDPNGVDMETRINGKVEKVQGKVLSSNDFTDADKQKLNSLPTNAQLTTTLNGKQEVLVNSEDITINNNKLSLTEHAKIQGLVEQWKASCCIYNGSNSTTVCLGDYDESRGLFSYAGKVFLTEAEVRKILATRLTRDNNFKEYWWMKAFLPQYIRHGTSIEAMFMYCRNVEIVGLYDYYESGLYVSSMAAAFAYCYKLKYIVGKPIDCGGLTAASAKAFAGCTALREVWLRNIKCDFEFKDSPNLELECFYYMVSNAVNTTSITITVHPTVYAKLIGDTTNSAYNDLTDAEKEQWTGLVAIASEKNILFATI